jgi:isopenicillin N synthase-like dioxygenase
MTPNPTLPILSLTTLETTPTALTTLSTACTTTGFFYLTDHGLPTTSLNHLLAHTHTFFTTTPPSTKHATLHRRAPDLARGYQSPGENVTQGRRDAHEAVDFYREWTGDERRDWGAEMDGLLGGENLWPDGDGGGLEGELRRHVEGVSAVARRLVRVMGLALGLEGEEEEALVEATERSFWVMRIIGYPPLDEAAEGVSCGEHTGE